MWQYYETYVTITCSNTIESFIASVRKHIPDARKHALPLENIPPAARKHASAARKHAPAARKHALAARKHALAAKKKHALTTREDMPRLSLYMQIKNFLISLEEAYVW